MSILKDSLAGRIADWGAPAMPVAQPALPADGRSYLRGGAYPPLVHITLPRLLASAVAQFGPRDALVAPAEGIRLSYYDLDRAVDELASGMLALGLARGDVLALQAEGARAHVLRLATARAGFVLAELSPELEPEQVRAALRVSGARVLVPGVETPLEALLPDSTCGPSGAISCPGLPDLKTLLSLTDPAPDGMLSLTALRAMAGPAQQLRLPGIDRLTDPDDCALILFGPDHLSGVAYSHYALVNAARCIAGLSGLLETDRLALCLPGAPAFSTGLLPALACGAAVLPAPADALPVVLQEARCTALRIRAQALAEVPADRPLSGVRLIVPSGRGTVTGPAIPLSLAELPDGLPLCLAPGGGWLQPHLEAKIVGADGRILPLGETGRLLIRGFALPLGYWRDPAQVFHDGWFDTGAKAAVDGDGSLRCTAPLA